MSCGPSAGMAANGRELPAFLAVRLVSENGTPRPLNGWKDTEGGTKHAGGP
jgi:hypothetical protein